jgi:hypothetical protein
MKREAGRFSIDGENDKTGKNNNPILCTVG